VLDRDAWHTLCQEPILKAATVAPWNAAEKVFCIAKHKFSEPEVSDPTNIGGCILK